MNFSRTIKEFNNPATRFKVKSSSQLWINERNINYQISKLSRKGLDNGLMGKRTAWVTYVRETEGRTGTCNRTLSVSRMMHLLSFLWILPLKIKAKTMSHYVFCAEHCKTIKRGSAIERGLQLFPATSTKPNFRID